MVDLLVNTGFDNSGATEVRVDNQTNIFLFSSIQEQLATVDCIKNIVRTRQREDTILLAMVKSKVRLCKGRLAHWTVFK